MLRIKVNAIELRMFSVGFFLMSSVQIHQLLVGYGKNRRAGNKKTVRGYATSKTLSTAATDDIIANSTEERKKSALYTKTGDKGFSSLYNGERRSKDDMIFHTLGHQDELNAVIGIASEHCIANKNGLHPMLNEIQSRLFDLGAAVATPVQNSSEEKVLYTKFAPQHTLKLEEWIDRLDAQLPPLTNFVVPSGGLSATHLNLARTVCRRAERSVVPLIEQQLVDREVGRYLNRLSDFLFAAQRTAVQREKRTEILWVKHVDPEP